MDEATGPKLLGRPRQIVRSEGQETVTRAAAIGSLAGQGALLPHWAVIWFEAEDEGPVPMAFVAVTLNV